MTTKREMIDRLQASSDTRFVAPSSTLAERLPALAAASGLAVVPRRTRVGRRVAALVGSIGILGWLTMAGAGAAVVGASATGVLPDPVQQFVADVVTTVGIDLPDPRQERRVNEERRLEVDLTGGGGSTTERSGPTSSEDVNGQSGTSTGNSGNAPGQSGTSNGNARGRN